MASENKNNEPVEKSILERIAELEAQIDRKKEQKIPLSKRLASLYGRVFCRQNLELGLSILSLAVSLSIAFYLFSR